jgi:hypothetical protein
MQRVSSLRGVPPEPLECAKRFEAYAGRAKSRVAVRLASLEAAVDEGPLSLDAVLDEAKQIERFIARPGNGKSETEETEDE